ncbi:MAG: nucleoside triphosphate pyrophosphohydrolase [Chloroflexi bacterium]|nr:nucleoside triphosphate pyrophosphohydrolase [Chloroflexota bacterium]
MEQDLTDFNTLVAIVARLRGPDGCPWDRVQTNESLRSDLMEECYEAMEALDEKDAAKLREELGDLLLVIALHTQIASEKSDFDMRQVVQGINEKVIHRHPHVFGAATARDAGEVAAQWEALKKEERHSGDSILSGLPKALPALTYSYGVQKRVARIGFDWTDTAGILEKAVEEMREIEQAPDVEAKSREFGDLLFTLVNAARHMGIDSEAALRGANRRFYERFAHMEKLCEQRGLEMAKLSFKEQNVLWEEAKRALG